MPVAPSLPSAAWAAPPARTRPRGLTARPAILLLLVLFLLSGGVLWHLGINYDGFTGSAAAKIHPASTLAGLLFLWALVASGDPVGFCLRTVRDAPASLLLLVVGSALLLQVTLRSGTGLAGAIDTFAGPALAMMLLVRIDPARLGPLEAVLHAVMLANAGLGLAEFATGQLVFPYRLDGETFPTDTRSAAFQGHPLVNALVTATYMLALIGGGGCLRIGPRLAMLALQGAALVTFGGRTAIVVVVVLGALHALVATLRVLRRGRVPLLGAAAGLAALAMAPPALVGLAVGGFFDRLAERFVSDGGSAHARLEMLALLDRIPLHELMFGPDLAYVETLRRMHGLEWGIENPIVRMLLYQGVFMTALLTIAVVLFVAEIVRRCRPGTLLPVVGFALLVNASESLASKTTLLAKFALILLALYRPLFPAAPRRIPHG
ncbi:VpsF family polysaccharide biosynthesis protein [Methylobacterium sp. Leaf118]|uniref:VpsF family polysaccharide biosynthesis protein n=1 Tax=Methylobacterium sp. Leaf118 TaxID=2876562 RepID=UPI001E3DF9EA|nr:VpsF family polysaccharide biosynthesis protein [Methylobacterium sp. Leaf118]